ncbi:MAG: FtsW/RodA/SpoVE family cell cycle protein [Lachnospiraceae bacterium]|nr:FtsW/RodA/SpoVE family cell cycle protein [Lachnospiraceae bacterium]
MKVKRLNLQDQQEKHSYDISLLFVTVFLCVFGLIMVYSASYYTAEMKGLGSSYYFRRQLISDLVGLAGLLLLSWLPYRLYKWAVLPAYAVAIVLMILTNYTRLGHTAGGRTRWINLFGITFQSAEVVKIAVILVAAFLIFTYAREYRGWKLWLTLLILTAVPAALVFSNDLSSAFIILAIPLIMIFLVNDNRKLTVFLIFLLILAAVAILLLKFMSLDRLMKIGDWLVEHTPLHEYQVRRLYVWNDPTYDARGDGYQVLQGLYAIGSGGIFGKGLGAGTQKLGFVPEASNDMIFTIICEELGLFGAFALILLYIFMLSRMVQIANRADDIFGSLIVVGIITQIAVQAVLHIGVVTNVFPNTGISLPFISYGGTSSAFLLAEVGMVISVGRGNTLRKKK